jgi:prevent-host-death family protein
MRTINVADAKKNLSEILGRVAFGHERVVISRRGKPMAMLVPIGMASQPHLADATGWLDDDDPFFATIDGLLDQRGHETLPDLDLRE